jgi:hypothetical protein
MRNSLDEEVAEVLEEVHAYEESHKGAYQRIFPADDDPLQYNSFFDGAKKAWHELSVSPRRERGK